MNEFQSTILTWYKKNKRDLPWRNTKDPYPILLSEYMLQQTQVTRVIEKYNLFLKTFPTIQDFSQATPAQIITMWEGLGYNRRALYLLRTIQKITNEWDGKIPKDEKQLQTCPGIGPYTAAAIQAFAFNKNNVVIDINILRIMERYFYGKPQNKETVTQTAESNLPLGKSRIWHNALMDFGAMICTDKPKCDICPLKKSCKGYKKDLSYSKPPKQSTFKGSDRFYRGEILRQLRKQSQTKQQLLKICIEKGFEQNKKNRFHTIIKTLEKDKLIIYKNRNYHLPTSL